MQRFPFSGADAGYIGYGSGKRRFMMTHCHIPAICEKERLSNRKNKSPAQAGDSACQITLRRGRLRHIAPLCRCSEFAVDFEIIVRYYRGPMWASAPTVRKTQVFRFSIFYADQRIQSLALLGPEGVAFGGIAKGDDQPGGGVDAGDLPQLFVINPA